MERRSFLGGVLGISVFGISGCSMLSGEGDQAGEPPVVADRSSKEQRNLRVEVSVRTEAGEPAANTVIRLNNRANSDPLTGHTGADGRIVFVDSVGPPPCNSVALSAPEHGVTESIGCHNGAKTVEATLEVPTTGAEGDEPTETAWYSRVPRVSQRR